MADVVKFTDEELASISKVKEKYVELATKNGQLQFAKTMLEKDIAKVQAEYETLLVEEQELVKKLSYKYGPGTLNPETGEFVPVK